MKKIVLSLLLAAGAASVGAQDMTGTWSGRADVGAARLRIVFHIGEDGGTMDSPDQGAIGIPLTRATFAADTLRVEVAPIGLSYTGVLRDGGFRGAFTQRGATFPLDLTRGEAEKPRRPQEPRPPFPYTVEDVTFENAEAGIRLAGTLTVPRGEGPFPAVVLLSGSGQQNRDEELMGHKPFLVLADHLTRKGIAVLRFDDRGVGGSGGDPRNATTADFATDAAAALDYLRSRPEADGRRVGLAGHSEGALIAFMAAASHPEKVAFVVSMAGPGMRGVDITVAQVRDMIAMQGATPEMAEAAAENQRRSLDLMLSNTPQFVEANPDSILTRMIPMFSALSEEVKEQSRVGVRRANSPWFRYFAEYDPAADIAKIRCPVLAVNGERDIQVRAAENLAAIAAALDKGGNRRVTTAAYPGLNHLFQTAGTGAITEYGQIEETFSERVMDDMAEWIIKATR
jgi:pimeloyl-ACP methyl ester carboxylesterase